MFSSAAFEETIYIIIDLLSSAPPVIFIGGSGGEILIKGKEIKTGNKKIDEFLYYFFNSHMVQSYVFYHFLRLYYEEESAIKKDLERSEEEE